MSVPPRFAGHLLSLAPAASSTSSAEGFQPTKHTFEIYLDYCCPFSAKQFKTITEVLIPKILKADDRYASGIDVIFRQLIQPWHPSSTLMHEAALAVLKTSPEKFWEFSKVLFEEQEGYFDANVVKETRNETYHRLAQLAGKVDGVDGGKIFELLEISGPKEDGKGGVALNGGNGVTTDLKWLTRMARAAGVHITPSVVWDGVLQDTSSSWGEKEWREWLEKMF